MNKSDTSPQRDTLEKVIGFRDYVAIGFGVIIGVGWVVYAGQWIKTGGTFGAILAFLIGGLCLIPIGKCYAELTSALPLTGGEVAFAYKAFGPLWSFLTAWALALNYVALPPFETIAIGAIAEATFPAIKSAALYEIGGYRISLSTIIPGLVAGYWIIWLNWRGAKNTARFQTLATAGLLLCTFLFCAVAFLNGDYKNMTPFFAGDGAWWAVAPASIISVLVIVPFFMTGFDVIPQAAEEAGKKVEPRQLGVAIVTSIIIGTAFYVLIIAALGYSVSEEQMEAILAQPDQLAMAQVFHASFGNEWAAKLVLIAAFLGIVSTLNGMFMAATRLLFALGRGGMVPHWFAVLHKTHHTPRNAIIFVGALSLAGPFVGKAGLGLIVNSGSFMFTAAILITATAALRLRKTAPELKRPYKIQPYTIWLGIIMSALLAGLMTFPGSPGQLGSAEFLTVILWMVLGLAFYYYRKRQNDMNADTQAEMVLAEYR
ncbi:APC family permease [Kordiimonas pumila]|uniref:APC family permease n=1 Tax=Kordiimonas pumila TaxID=2161677 RepID=A0ABV7D2V4_9PROT|nr:APC family permease [Kordiimonas pumila]